MTTDSSTKTPKRRPKLHYMKEWRQERDITQEELAERVGSTKSLISRYEAHVTGMTLELMFRIMAELNVGLEEFFDAPEKAKKTTERLSKIKRFHRRIKKELEGS
jgi:transcriptional regulator with XRE-family HTH domain